MSIGLIVAIAILSSHLVQFDSDFTLDLRLYNPTAVVSQRKSTMPLEYSANHIEETSTHSDAEMAGSRLANEAWQSCKFSTGKSLDRLTTHALIDMYVGMTAGSTFGPKGKLLGALAGTMLGVAHAANSINTGELNCLREKLHLQ